MDTILDDAYMKKHLADYVLFQADQGYAVPDIKKALLRFGYPKKLVKEILDHLHITPRAKPAMYSVHDLDEELKIYVQSLLIDYIIKEHKVGYSLEAIKKALMNFGHDPKAIEEAIQVIKQGKVVDYRAEADPVKFALPIVSSLTLFLIFAFLVFLSISTNTSILEIIPQFAPGFLAFFVTVIAFPFMPKKIAATLPLLSVIVAASAFIGGTTYYPVIPAVPGSAMILILNGIIAFIASGIVCAFSRRKQREESVVVKDKKARKKHQAEAAQLEKKVKTPKLVAEPPKEPYHPKMAHPKDTATITRAASAAIPGKHPNTYNKENSMLRYLRDEIDKPKKRSGTKALHALPPQHQRKQREKLKKI